MNEPAKLSGSASVIKSKQIQQVYSDFISSKDFKEKQDKPKEKTFAPPGKVTITIGKIEIDQPSDENRAILKVRLKIKPEKAKPSDVINEVEKTISDILQIVENRKNLITTLKESVKIINRSQENNSILNASNYQGDLEREYTYYVCDYSYSFNINSIVNSSNTTSTPEDTTDIPTSTLPLNYTSNIDKFLIDLRDHASNTGAPQGKLPVYDYITTQLKDGVLEKLRELKKYTTIPNTSNDLSGRSEEEQMYWFIKKGFNSEYLSGETTENQSIAIIPDVNYEELFYVYKSGLSDNQTQGETSKFYYIKLGLLLYYINNSSLIYGSEDTDTKSLKKPYVYIDYNPETNFCLTTGYQFSIDPAVCITNLDIIPDQFKDIFPDSEITSLFSGKEDFFSPNVDSGYKTKTSTREFRGNIMNLCINIDYIINLIQKQSNSSSKSDVYLRSFLEILMDDVNKSLGNINSFRVGYYDEANTIRIYDDQYINPPSIQGEVINGGRLNELMNNNGITLPITGKNSILRTLQLKTTVSSKLSQQIAISSQAAEGPLGSLNSDGSGINSISINLRDRLIPVKQESVKVKKGAQQNIQITEGDKGAATTFNQHVIDIYSKGRYTAESVNTARNYYCAASNKKKAEFLPTKNRLILPLGIELGMDGISGLSLLEGFTIPVDVLPKQYLDENRKSKVGFVVSGLNHTISDNQWVTTITGQMMTTPIPNNTYLNEIGSVSTSTGGGKKNANFVTSGGNNNTNFIASNNEAKIIAENYLGKTISDSEWSMLVSATFAEASSNQEERAHVMGVMLNRVRSNFGNKSTINDILRAPGQFQAVTGTKNNGHQASPRFTKGPNLEEAKNIYGSVQQFLPNVDKKYVFFTSALTSAYGEGTDITFRQTLLNNQGIRIGDTIFSKTAVKK